MLFEHIVDGLPFRWDVIELDAPKTCPQEIDILIYKDGTDLHAMTEAAPGAYAAITGQQQFLTLWLPTDVDERYNLFVHGYDKQGQIVFNRSIRWYNTLRRRSLPVSNMADVDHFRFGQFDVSFADGKPVYKNLWAGLLPKAP